MKTPLKFAILGFFAATLFVGCYPDDDDATYSDFDVAATHHDTEFDFSKITSVVIFDTVAHIVDEGDEITNDDTKYDGDAIKQIEQNFIALYGADSVFVLNRGDIIPDAAKTAKGAVTLTAMQTDVYYGYTYPYWGYWGWYGGWYWYWKSGELKSASNTNYYPYYPYYPTGYTYAYTTGTLMFDLIDATRVDTAHKILPVVWTGVINGILGSTTADTEKRLKSNIDQCFIQSPYLKQ